MKRRDFIKTASMAGLGTGITLLNFPVFGKSAPGNKLVLAVMGVNSRGNWLAQVAARLPGAEIGYICDVEDEAIAKGLKAVASVQSRKPTVIKDIRKLLEQRDFDALFIAAPDHWHAPAAIMAAAAGKHVYVEKPCAHNPQEGEWLVAAARKYNRLIQMGNQRRSWPNLQQAVKEVKEDGILGKVYYGRGWYVNNRAPIGTGKKIAVPGTLDWNLWQGPAPRMDYLDNIVHYNWHWRWHWGTSETCNNATHELDCLRWFMDLDFPIKVTSAGGRYAYPKDDWETPDTQTLQFEFEGGKAVAWEGRSCSPFNLEGSSRGFALFGENGSLYNSGGDHYKILDTKNKVVKEVKQAANAERSVVNTVSPAGEFYDAVHISNFLESIRGNDTLHSDISSGYRSTLLCLLGNIAQRTGRVLHTDPANGHILHDAEAMKMWRRSYEKGWIPII
ncbi:Gfo/Idh/MocA family protein [Chitinophaga nivalis]|uniref:Gfo/Idh/MocA family oxidoreductase n=1 Tax=Chitinophaga nivalis TaxID=2991709 RepID=A0ABT3ITC5_9BACT|nr:Gfo/Idh/MocA family oxidoreductase [Chitinophaga nivalis]MCW3463082.1 Gfo/Idh/MocA family oxidoreductase [Chitinophaga nivalis]MCW3487228.1 Gfo/Idh/MocA family oxidoreductase [Chitinophaga nivalis]